MSRLVLVCFSIVAAMGCGSSSASTAPSGASTAQVYTASLAPTEAQSFVVSLATSGVITATITGVTPSPPIASIYMFVGVPAVPPSAGVHGCTDDFSLDLQYGIPGVPASIKRTGPAGSYCVALINGDTVSAHTVSLSINVGSQ